jgi:hypothetical protein
MEIEKSHNTLPSREQWNYLPNLIHRLNSKDPEVVQIATLAITNYSTQLTIDKARTKISISQFMVKGDNAGHNGTFYAQSIVSTFLVYMQDCLNVTNKMSDMQLVQCAAIITSEFKCLSFEDLLIFLKKLIKGEYGQFYNKIDVSVVVGALSKYLASEDYLMSIEREATAYKSHKDYIQHDGYKALLERVAKDLKQEPEQVAKKEVDTLGKLYERLEQCDKETLLDLLHDARIQGHKEIENKINELLCK